MSATQLQAHIMAADVASAGTATVTVFNPAPGGGISNSVAFVVPAATIAFQSARALDGSDAKAAKGILNIWTMGPDGSTPTPITKLTSAGANSSRPIWSPDGTKIAFESFRALNGSDNGISASNAWVMNADGSSPTPLTTVTAVGADAVNLAWSPDGTKVAFESARALDGTDAANSNNTSNIWVVNADGTTLVPLTKLKAQFANSFNPVWSPDGSKIAFESARALDGTDAGLTNHTVNIWVVNADGSGATPLTKLTSKNASHFHPAWSPDGSKLAFDSPRELDGTDAANGNITPNIWAMNADGSSPTPLTTLTAVGVASVTPVWSPDGTSIAFVSTRALDGTDASNTNFSQNIWVMKADGSSQSHATGLTQVQFDANGLDISWMPSGKALLFTSERALNLSDAANVNNTANIWTVNADGTNLTPLTGLTAAGADCRAPNRP